MKMILNLCLLYTVETCELFSCTCVRIFLKNWAYAWTGWTGTPGLMLFRENGALFYHFCPKILLF